MRSLEKLEIRGDVKQWRVLRPKLPLFLLYTKVPLFKVWPDHPLMSLLHLAGDHHRVEGLEGVACTQRRGRVGLLRLNPCRSNQNANNTNNNRNMWPANTNVKTMTNRKQQGNKKPQQITKKMKMQRNKQPNNKYTKQQQIHRRSLIP